MSAPPPLPQSGFVTVLGRISTLLGALGVLAALSLAVVAAALGDGFVAQVTADPLLPPAVDWALGQRRPLALSTLLLSLLFLAASWGVLRRQEWARRAFIAFLAVTGVLNFATVPLVGQVFDTVQAIYPAALLDTPDGQELLAQLRVSRFVSLVSATLTALVFAVLHGWVAWKLCTAEVRAEFRSHAPRP